MKRSHPIYARIFRQRPKHDRGATLIELLVTLAIAAGVMSVLVGALMILFSIDEQSDTYESAQDDVRLVFETIEREIQQAVGSITAGDCVDGVCGSLTFELPMESTTVTVAYRKAGDRIQKAIETTTWDQDPCYQLAAPVPDDSACWQDITGASTNISVLDFSIAYPGDASLAEKSPLVSIGLRGEAPSLSGGLVTLEFSTVVNPRSKIKTGSVPTVQDQNPPTISYLAFTQTGANVGYSPTNGSQTDYCYVYFHGNSLSPYSFVRDGAFDIACGSYPAQWYIPMSIEDTNGISYVDVIKNGALVEREIVDGAPTSFEYTPSGEWEYTSPPDGTGPLTFTFRAVDVIGNVTENTITLYYPLPVSKPSIGSATPSGCGAGARVTVAWGGGDPETKFDVQMDAEAPHVDKTSPYAYPVSDGAAHTFRVRAYNAFNEEWSDSFGPVVANGDCPAMEKPGAPTITGVDEGARVGCRAIVSWVPADAYADAFDLVMLDGPLGTAFENVTSPYEVPYQLTGMKSFQVRAYNAAGESRSQSVLVDFPPAGDCVTNDPGDPQG